MYISARKKGLTNKVLRHENSEVVLLCLKDDMLVDLDIFLHIFLSTLSPIRLIEGALPPTKPIPLYRTVEIAISLAQRERLR